MKKSVKTTMGVMLMAATGIGAWALYKKYSPKVMESMDHLMKNVSKDIEKNLDDMM